MRERLTPSRPLESGITRLPLLLRRSSELRRSERTTSRDVRRSGRTIERGRNVTAGLAAGDGGRGWRNGEFVSIGRRTSACSRRTLTMAVLCALVAALWTGRRRAASTANARASGPSSGERGSRRGRSHRMRLAGSRAGATPAGAAARRRRCGAQGVRDRRHDGGIARVRASTRRSRSSPRGSARARATRTVVLDFLRSHGARDVRIDATGLFADATMSAADRRPRVRDDARTLPRRDRCAVHGAGVDRLAAGRVCAASSPASLGWTRCRFRCASDARPHPAPQRASVARASHGTPSPRRTSSAARRSSRPRRPAWAPQSGCAGARSTGGFTPNEYLTAYGYEPLQEGLLGQGERVALIEIDGFKVSDIDAFARCFGLQVPRINGFGLGRPEEAAGRRRRVDARHRGARLRRPGSEARSTSTRPGSEPEPDAEGADGAAPEPGLQARRHLGLARAVRAVHRRRRSAGGASRDRGGARGGGCERDLVRRRQRRRAARPTARTAPADPQIRSWRSTTPPPRRG